MNTLNDVFNALELGPPQQFDNLSVFPLIGSRADEPSYETLDAALGLGSVRITETSEAGSVPEIRVLNTGGRAVLIVDGEELVGAKQNRTVNLTILVPPQSDLVVPVTCVEAGRWHARTSQFASAQRMHFAEGRAAKSRQVTESLLASGVPRANQSQVWSAIAAKAERLQTRSETSAMSDMFEAHAASVDKYVEAITAVAGQRGAVFAIDGRPIGIEIFDSPRTFTTMLPKLLRGYAIDAFDREVSRRAGGDVPGDTEREPTPVAIRDFLSYVSDSRVHHVPSIGAGESWRIVAPLLSGGVLTSDGEVLHASVFWV